MKTLRTSTGTHLAYRDQGQGTPILLIHGWGVSGELFDQQLQGLAQHFRIVVPDLPGHGASGGFHEDDPFTSLADSLAELIVQLELEPVCLVGWSLGAMVAWDLILRHPELGISGLVTIDMVPCLLSDTDWPYGLHSSEQPEVFERHVKMMLLDWPAYTALFVPRIFAPGDSEQAERLVNDAIRVALANKPGSLAPLWMRMSEQDFRPLLSRIAVPALLVCGRHSQLYGAAACRWATEQMPNGRALIFEHSGHAPHLEEPERFNRILAEFSDSQAPRKTFEPTDPAETGIAQQ